jgi:glycosyltransferase involved in cell wall biosynthesis
MKTWILTSNIFDQNSIDNISLNFMNLYRDFFTEFEVISINKIDELNLMSDSSEFVVEKFKNEKPKVIAIIHPYVFRHPVLRKILQESESSDVIFNFHVLGDFIKKGANFLEIEDLLLNKKVNFLFPSENYKRSMSCLFSDSSYPAAFPIPSNQKDFYFSNKLREEYRYKLNILKDEFVFLYTGRICSEKNIEKTIVLLNQLKLNFKFLIVGEFDDFQNSTISPNKKLGTTYHEILPFLSDKIKHISPRNKKDLNGLYNAADFFISLSTYHDESFGMSAAEALSTGLSTILTRWGGYQDFLNLKLDNTISVDITYNNNSLVFDDEKLLKNIILKTTEGINREYSSQFFLNEYSLTKLKSKFSFILSNTKNFSGYSDLFKNLIIASAASKYTTNWDLKNYTEIYSEFWRQK